MKLVVTRYSAWQPISTEALFDHLSLDIVDGKLVEARRPLWLHKEWFRRGHGQGRTGPKAKLP